MGPRGGLKTACIVCDKQFSVAPSKAAAGAGTTCSMKCRNEIRGFGRHVRAALPGTVRQVAERTSVDIACVRDLLGDMVRADTCHVAGFELNPITGHGAPKYMPVMALGPSPDPDMPKDMRAAGTWHTGQLVLKAMPLAAVDIAAALGVAATTVQRIVDNLHESGKCHVGEWRRAVRGSFVAIYYLGDGEDAPCRLKKLTQAQKDKRYKRKMKNDPELSARFDARAAKGRARYWEKKAATVRDPMLAAMFGPATSSTPTEDSV